MDADNSPARSSPAPITPASGGTVEPANRATIAKERFQTPIEASAQRYELRDPFAEVTYRTTSLPEMVAKANQLGSSRFVAIDEQGQRTNMQKVAGMWQEAAPHAPQPPVRPQRTAEVTPIRGDAPAQSRPTPSSRVAAAPDIAPFQSLAAIDAKAERAVLVAQVEAALSERYVIKRAPVKLGDLTLGHTEYRYRGDTNRVAFTESTFRLATDNNNPSVARSMVDVAQARNWKALRVSGNEDFKRLIWLEANARGVKTLGYEPMQADLDLLKRERETRLVNRIEPIRTVASDPTATGSAPKAKTSERGAGGRKTVLAAIEAVLIAKGVPEWQREAVMVAAAEKLEQRIRAGQAPKVKVYDPAAPSQRPAATPTLDKQRNRERAAPTR
jgi:hypothetical protein